MHLALEQKDHTMCPHEIAETCGCSKGDKWLPD